MALVLGLNLGRTGRWGCAGRTAWELSSAVGGEALAVTGKAAEIAIEGGVTGELSRAVTADHPGLGCDGGALGSS